MATRTTPTTAIETIRGGEPPTPGHLTQDHHRRDPALLYGVQEAADMLGIGRSHAYELMTAGRIKYVKVGSRRLIPRTALLAFVDELVALWSDGG